MAKTVEVKASELVKTESVVDGKTGEVSHEKATLDHAAMNSFLRGKDGLAALEAATKAKKEDFKAFESDFWAPQAVGDFLQGIYLGSGQGAKYKEHAIGKLGEDKKPLVVKINGTLKLNSELPRGEIGTPVRVTFLGKIGATEGRKMNTYDVAWLKS